MFYPVIELPAHYSVFDFSHGPIPEKMIEESVFGIGKYNEKRPDIYTSSLFSAKRNIHMGIDIFAPVNTPIHAFSDGEIFLFGYNGGDLDYGYTLVTQHSVDGAALYSLYGHLSEMSLKGKKEKQKIVRGEVIAWIGDRRENGGWFPHLHFQLSYEKPDKPDMPGVVAEDDLPGALVKYPDPRLVLGPLYP